MISRRSFVQTGLSAVTAALAVPNVVSGKNLNSKLQLAGIGCDGKGWDDIQQMASHPQAQFVAFCDVDLNRTAKVRQLQPEASIYQDYRELFEQLGDKVDAVTVSTPDHMHAIICRAALTRRHHVFCQKPLTHTVWEARHLQQLANQAGVITRMGNQIHSHSFYRTAVKVIQSGLIGKIQRVHSWCGASGNGFSRLQKQPETSPMPPKELAWDLWLGVAPSRSYGGNGIYHPFGWRSWQDFGNGALGDFGCHIFDPVFTALALTEPPNTIQTEHSGWPGEVWPAQTSVRYQFPGTPYTTDRTINITWDDGGRKPDLKATPWADLEASLPGSGSLFIGEAGALVLPHVGQLQLYPQTQFAQVSIEAEPNLNHYHDWLAGCLANQQPTDGFDYACPLTAAVLLGNIAARYPGEELEWDAQAFQIRNKPTANRWLTREYRDGWDFPAIHS